MISGPAGRPDAPGWYPDTSTGRMRKWDGERWTGESRDMPPWAGTATRKGRPARHWIVFGGLAGLLFLAVSVKALTSGVKLPPRTVHDQSFISAANARCRDILKPLKEDRPRPGTPESKDPGSNEKVAGQVDDVADRLEALADDLRGIPVHSEDQAAVQGWLADWDRYNDLGHQYADLVRGGTQRQQKVAAEGVTTGRRADLFARANGLDD
ncbi:MAG: hypothetical protein QOI20_3077, partial [Acidimicrobiaceae bacterium]|nr:hypothetical protein [Acidimicrobiaceae bacterium]